MSALLMTAACDSGSGPAGPGAPDGRGPDIGIITELPSPEVLIGAWIRDDRIEHRKTPALQTSEWRFDGRGTCRLTITVHTIDAVTPLVEESICTYRADGRTITFQFGTDDFGRGEELSVRWRVEEPDVLVLDEDRYHRFRR